MSVEDLETRIVAMCEAIGAGVTRASLWERFSDDFETEGDLAKCLGRLTASGRLYRGARKRPGLSDEFIYSASPVAADPVARANPASLKSFVDSHREPVLPNLAAAPSKPETPPMSKTSDARQRYIDHLASTRTWLAPSEIAKALKVKPELTSYHLNVALEHKQLQAIGHRSTRKFAALGVAAARRPVEGDAGAGRRSAQARARQGARDRARARAGAAARSRADRGERAARRGPGALRDRGHRPFRDQRRQDDDPPHAAGDPQGDRLPRAHATRVEGRRVIARPRARRPSVRERLRTYPDEVLVAAIASEQAKADARPMFIQMLEAELERRRQQEKT
jgi:hypothetical protein